MEINAAYWEMLKTRAQRIIEKTIAELPREIRVEAEKVACLFQEECADDPDVLGTYGEGGDFVPGQVSSSNGPIVLYLATIADFCEEEDEDFDAEVRLTYLHELGHHFGWDEGDLEERGLD